MYYSAQSRPWHVWTWVIVSLVIALLVLGVLTHSLGKAKAADEPPPPAIYVIAPCDGVFYAGEYFGAEPYIALGSEVLPLTPVGTVEGMRTSTVHAGVEGTVTELLVADSEMVAIGQPLMRIQPANATEGTE